MKPEHNEQLPDCWQAVEDLTSAGVDRLLLYGPSGTGKTYYGLTSKSEGQAAYRLICSEEMTTAQIEGAFYPSSVGFEYREGVAVRAWREGARLVVDEVARRPQVQERMTHTIADLIENELSALGVIVVIEAEHTCMTIRGVKKPGALTVTSAVRGQLRNNLGSRAEAMALINGK